jgi:hypothetical protein
MQFPWAVFGGSAWVVRGAAAAGVIGGGHAAGARAWGLLYVRTVVVRGCRPAVPRSPARRGPVSRRQRRGPAPPRSGALEDVKNILTIDYEGTGRESDSPGRGLVGCGVERLPAVGVVIEFEQCFSACCAVDEDVASVAVALYEAGCL